MVGGLVVGWSALLLLITSDYDYVLQIRNGWLAGWMDGQ
jgi:hypothetical protein